MRILRIADVGGHRGGGMSGYMLQSSEALERRGHTVQHLFAEDLPQSVTGPLRRIVLPWQVVMAVRRIIAAGLRPDVVEIHEPLGAAYALLRRPLRLPPLAAMSYGLETRGWAASIERARRTGQTIGRKSRITVPATLLVQARVVYHLADVVAASSTIDREYLLKEIGRPARSVVFAPSGASPANFLVERDLTPRAFTVLFVGSWLDRKGDRELVEAWARIRAAVPGAHLVLAGTGSPAEAVLARFADAPDGVTVLPSVDQPALRGLFASADVFVLPSWFEGLPLSLLEAAAAGLPCITTGVCGNLDVFRPPAPEDDGGILIPPHDALALADAVLRLAGDAGLRRSLGDRARERARAFSWTATASALEQGYFEAMTAGRSDPRADQRTAADEHQSA